MKKRSITIDGHRTSISLEDEFWDALKDIATQKHTHLATLITQVDNQRKTSLSSALRVFVLNYFKPND